MTPTNLLYDVIATPGALYRYWRQGQTGGRLALVLIAGTLPGVIAGSVIRVKLLPGPHVFDLVVAAVLIPLGIWLALTTPPSGTGEPDRPVRPFPAPVLAGLAAVVGCVGGIYGSSGSRLLVADDLRCGAFRGREDLLLGVEVSQGAVALLVRRPVNAAAVGGPHAQAGYVGGVRGGDLDDPGVGPAVDGQPGHLCARIDDQRQRSLVTGYPGSAARPSGSRRHLRRYACGTLSSDWPSAARRRFSDGYHGA